MSIPYELENAIPLQADTLGLDRLPIGKVRSNAFNTRYYACIDSQLLTYLKRTQLVDSNEV